MLRFLRSRPLMVVGALAPAACALAACAQILGIEPNPVLVDGGASTSTGSGMPAMCQGTLRVRITSDFSGTAQDIAQPYSQAIYDYMRDLEASGGLRGCHIDYDLQNGGYTAPITEQVVTTWAADPTWSEVTTLFIFGTGPTTAVAAMPQVTMQKPIIIPGSYAGSLASPLGNPVNVTYEDNEDGGIAMVQTTEKTSPYPYVFFPATDYSTAIRIGLAAAQGIQGGSIALVYDGLKNGTECAYCVDPLVAGKSYFGKLPDLKLAADIATVPQTSDPSQIPTIAANIRAAINADIQKYQGDSSYVPIQWLWCGNSVTSCAGVAKGAGQANADIKAKITNTAQQWQVRVMANNWGIGETSSQLCGTGDGKTSDCDGVLYGLFPVPRYGDTTVAEGMQALTNLHDKYSPTYDGGPNAFEDVRYVQGYVAALLWRKAVETALDAGHAKPTGVDLKNALETLQQVSLEGMTAGPISFTASDHRPQGKDWIYYLQHGTLTLAPIQQQPASLTLDPTWLGY